METTINLQQEFEAFILAETEASHEEQLKHMLATPYGDRSGALAAAFHMFQYAYNLGKQNV